MVAAHQRCPKPSQRVMRCQFLDTIDWSGPEGCCFFLSMCEDVGEESLTERMTRRNLALSQLTKPAASVPSSSNAPPALSTNATIPGSAR